MPWARIENNEVKEITAIDPAGRFHSSLIWVECAANVEGGWSYDGSNFAAPAAPVDNRTYAQKRMEEYPSAKDFLEAYTEKEIGSDSTKWDAYVIAYNKVRTDNPK